MIKSQIAEQPQAAVVVTKLVSSESVITQTSAKRFNRDNKMSLPFYITTGDNICKSLRKMRRNGTKILCARESRFAAEGFVCRGLSYAGMSRYP